MAKQLAVIFISVLAYFNLAQNGVTANEIEKIFKINEIIPDVIQIAPKEFLQVSYTNCLNVKQGNKLTPTQVQLQPKVKWESEDDEYYTLIMTDPDAPSRSNHEQREFLHWLVANIPGNNVNEGGEIAAYVGSGPPKDTGFHRYVFLLYKQPRKLNFEETYIPNNSRRNRPKFKAANFAEKYNMGPPVAGNFFKAQYDDYVPFVHAQLSENN